VEVDDGGLDFIAVLGERACDIGIVELPVIEIAQPGRGVDPADLRSAFIGFVPLIEW
jgi:hypothetical protein